MNKLRKSLLLISLLFCISTIPVMSAEQDSIPVDGTVVDAITGDGIENAELIFMTPDSTVVSRGRTVDLCKKFGVTDGTVFIRFDVKVPKWGKYILRVSYPKYADKFVDVDIPEKQYGKPTIAWEVPIVNLDRSYTSLSEAVVTASKVMMVNKGDTVVYNASAFTLAEGSMLDALIAQLPGVRLTADGQIFVNDQYVSCLLVNGKDFFQGDPGVALKNLPAYTVDKVKAYKRGDKSAYLFERDSTEKVGGELVLDVGLKKEFMGSIIANADVGYGTDDRYSTRFFGMRFTSKQRLAAFANLNNIGQRQKPGENIDLSAEAVAGRPVTEKSGGLDFFAEIGKRKIVYNSALIARHTDSKTVTETAANSTLPDFLSYTRSRSISQACRTEAEWRNMLSVPLSKVYSEYTFGATYGKQKNQSLNQSVELDAMPYESYRLSVLDSVFGNAATSQLLQSLINRYSGRAYDNTERYSFIGSALVKWKAPLTGNPISIYAEASYERQNSDNDASYALTTYPQPKSINRGQRISFSQNDLRGTVRLDYEYQLPKLMKLIARYDFSAERTQSNRLLDTMFLSANTDIARLFAADLYNSYDREQRKLSHTPELQWRYSSPKWLISARFPVRFSQLRLNEFRLMDNVSAYPRHNYAAFEPSLMVNSNKGFAFSYSYRKDEPNMVYLTGLRDTSDPLSEMLGNTNLVDKGTHTATINYSLSRAEKVQNLGLSASFVSAKNDVALSREYDVQTGVSSYLPRNVNGNYDFQFRGSYSQAVGKRKSFFPEVLTQFNLVRTIGYSGLAESGGTSVRMAMKSMTLAQQLGIKYQSGDVSLRLLARGEWLKGISSQQDVADVSIRKFRYAAVATLPLVWDIKLSADFSLHTLRGFEEQSMNTDNFVLNASLSKSFLRDKALTLQLTGFDLFDQLKDIGQTVNAMGRIETWTNSLHRYAMVHLIYRFSKKPKDR